MQVRGGTPKTDISGDKCNTFNSSDCMYYIVCNTYVSSESWLTVRYTWLTVSCKIVGIKRLHCVESPTVSECLKVLRRFFYSVFHIQWQKYLFENVDFFWHLMWKMFCHLYRADSTKTNLWTCNLWIKWSVSYKSLNLFWFNYFCHWMWKTICCSDRANSNLWIDIFDIGCEKYSRRNAFWLRRFQGPTDGVLF